ncbi:hypothetical protein LIER_20336 [Lithospermum erythrorhizon]|uniref:Uncharacterized protein n=1 Tax=Lithospermum erythrorhizon TaxID=34254 RepID=A0AAV3QP48_LITER
MQGTTSQHPLVRYIQPLFEKLLDRIYGSDVGSWIRTVDEGMHELFLEYVVQSLPPSTFVENPHESVERTDGSR